MLTKNNLKIRNLLLNVNKLVFIKPILEFLIEDFHFGHLFYVQFQILRPILFCTFIRF